NAQAAGLRLAYSDPWPADPTPPTDVETGLEWLVKNSGQVLPGSFTTSIPMVLRTAEATGWAGVSNSAEQKGLTA
ncbi:hypothetical protein NW820_12060, partial [Synechococcus sp. R55.7]|uniref:hypothetical protein n=1 Tax=Synechococcus sp. R55.7 TaxID=2964500 RepID=UPI0039C05532